MGMKKVLGILLSTALLALSLPTGSASASELLTDGIIVEQDVPANLNSTNKYNLAENDNDVETDSAIDGSSDSIIIENDIIDTEDDTIEVIPDEASSDSSQEITITDISEDTDDTDQDTDDASFADLNYVRSLMLSMDIKGFDGKVYHISDFTEKNIVVLFGHSGCGNTVSMLKKAAKIRDTGKSIRIIVIGIRDNDSDFKAMVEDYSAFGSPYSYYNNRYMWEVVRATKEIAWGTVSATTPMCVVMDSQRNVTYSQDGGDILGLCEALGYAEPCHTYKMETKYDQTESRKMLDLVNDFRTGSEAWAWNEDNTKKVKYENLGKLTYDYGLEKVAMQRAAEIAIIFAHERPNGKSCFTAYKLKGTCGENIAVDCDDDYRNIFGLWKEDKEDYYGQGHRRNMLNADFKYIGIACAYVGDISFWVQEFNSVPTDLGYTEPAMDTRGVDVEILDEYVLGKALESDYSGPGTLTVGGGSRLPKIREKIKTDSFYIKGFYIYGATPKWTVSDSSILRIDTEKNRVEALKPGTATFSASIDGLKKDFKVTVVSIPVKEVTVKQYKSASDAQSDKSGTTIKAGATIDVPYGQKTYVLAKAVPESSSSSFNSATTAEFKSDYFDYNSSTGELTAEKVGASEIKFVSKQDTTKSATIKINVKSIPITEIHFEKSHLMVGRNTSADLTLTAAPSNTSEKIQNVTWSSSDTSVVTVSGSNEKGKITTKDKEGTAVITAKMGKLQATMTVQVTSFIRFEKDSVDLIAKPGLTHQLSVILENSTYKESELKWTSSDTSLLKVSKGLVTVVKSIDDPATVTVTAATNDGKFKATCKVKLSPWGRAEAPFASLSSGEVDAGTRLLLLTQDHTADIYYCIDYDESDGISAPAFDTSGKPKSGTILYEDAITLGKTCAVTYIARKEDLQDSKPVTSKYTVTYNWGDVSGTKLRKLFKDVTKVPEGLWCTFGNETAGYTAVYEESASTAYSVPYTGEKAVFNDDICVFHGTRRLWENRDYTVSYANNQAAADTLSGKAPTVIIKGKGSYASSASFKFTIAKASLQKASIASEKVLTIKAGEKLTAVKPVVAYNGKNLTAGKDYALVFYRTSVSDKNKVAAPAKESTEAGQIYLAEVVATETGNFTGKAKESITIKCIDSKNKSVVQMSKVKVTVPKQVYDGVGISVKDLFAAGKATVTNGKKTLTYGEDYEVVSSGKFTDTGKHSFIIRGTARTGDKVTSYVGDKTAVLEITGIPASKVKVAAMATTVTFTGKAFALSDLYAADKTSYDSVTLYSSINGKNVVLTQGTDFTVTMPNSGATGKLAVRFDLKGRYSGTIAKTVTVKPANIANATVTASDAYYSKDGAIPEVTVTMGKTRLRQGIDYTLSFANNKKVASAGDSAAPTAVVTGIGNYSQTAKKAFTIKKISLAGTVSLVAADKVFKENAPKGYFKSVPKIMDGGTALQAGKDYKQINPKTDFHYYIAGTGTEILDTTVVPAGTRVEVRIELTCPESSPYVTGTYQLKGYYRILNSGKDISSATIKIKDPSKFTFNNGKLLVPVKSEDLIVKVGSRTLTASDYEIVSVTGNQYLGTAKVVICGKGQYGGTKSFTFKVTAKPLK